MTKMDRTSHKILCEKDPDFEPRTLQIDHLQIMLFYEHSSGSEEHESPIRFKTKRGALRIHENRISKIVILLISPRQITLLGPYCPYFSVQISDWSQKEKGPVSSAFLPQHSQFFRFSVCYSISTLVLNVPLPMRLASRWISTSESNVVYFAIAQEFTKCPDALLSLYKY